MKLFNKIDELRLITQINNIHDIIFSKPTKNYIFYLKLFDVAAGTIFPGYFFMKDNVEKNINI